MLFCPLYSAHHRQLLSWRGNEHRGKFGLEAQENPWPCNLKVKNSITGVEQHVRVSHLHFTPVYFCLTLKAVEIPLAILYCHLLVAQMKTSTALINKKPATLELNGDIQSFIYSIYQQFLQCAINNKSATQLNPGPKNEHYFLISIFCEIAIHTYRLGNNLLLL